MSFSLTDHFVSVSEFSQRKANRIFNDVANNNQEYVVVKNNKPTAVVLSVEKYQKLNDRLKRLEAYVEQMDKLKKK